MKHHSPIHLGARLLGRVAIVCGLSAGALGFGPSASAAELPVNEFAEEITASAARAVAAYEDYVESEWLVDYLEYSRYRADTARYVARELGYSEFDMVVAWQETTLEHQRAVLAAMTQIGVPYRTNTSVEDEGFDCSGLTYYAWKESGLELVRQSGSQIAAAARLDQESAKAGDLVHYPGHVMMYLGVEDAIVHSVNTGRTVEIDTITSTRRVTFGDPLA